MLAMQILSRINWAMRSPFLTTNSRAGQRNTLEWLVAMVEENNANRSSKHEKATGEIVPVIGIHDASTDIDELLGGESGSRSYDRETTHKEDTNSGISVHGAHDGETSGDDALSVGFDDHILGARGS